MSIPNYHADVYDNGPAYLVANCTLVVALSSEAVSYSEATTTLGNGSGRLMGTAAVGPADFVLRDGAAPVVRELAFLGKNGGVAVATGDPAVLAFLDAVNSKILAQTSETGSVVLPVVGSQLVLPAFSLMKLQAPVLG